MISIIILAAGESTRFGELKQLYKINNKSFINLILSNIKKLPFKKEIIVGTGFQKEKIIKEIQSIDKTIKIAVNKDYSNGQLSTFQECLKICDPKSEGYMMILSDHPFVQFPTYKNLISQFQKNNHDKILIPKYNSRKGHPVIFSKKYKSELLNGPLDKGAREIVNNNKENVLLISVDDPFILADIDKKEILKTYLKKINSLHDLSK